MGLGESFTNLRGQMLLMQPLPHVSKAYSMLRQEEKQRDFTKPPSSVPIMLNTITHNQRLPFSNTKQYRHNSSTPSFPSKTGTQSSEIKSQFMKGVFCDYFRK